MSAPHAPQRKPASPEAVHRRSLSRQFAKAARRAGVKPPPTYSLSTDPRACLNETDAHLWEVFRRWREIQIRRMRPGDAPRYVVFSFNLFLLELCCRIREADLVKTACIRHGTADGERLGVAAFDTAWRWWLSYDDVSRIEIARRFRVERKSIKHQQEHERSVSPVWIDRTGGAA